MQRYVCVPHAEIFDFWINNDFNVLFYGRHGVGKTSMILDAFNRNNLKYQTFSASTMDPWVDFIGVPKEVKDEKGAYLDLIRPKAFRDDEVEALFFDELNRSHKKIRNAIMELIQFKSINGRKFPKLRMIWGAVNPSEDSDLKYDVEQLDPAQADRFHVQIEIPYKPHAPYLRAKYGRDKADAAIDWWNDLPEKMQIEISPRRLEYAMQMHEKNGNLAFVLPQNSNFAKLKHALSHGCPRTKYSALLLARNEKDLEIWLQDENNYSAIQGCIVSNPNDALHLISEERVVSLAIAHQSVSNFLFNNYDTFKTIIDNLAENAQDKNLLKNARKVSTRNFVQSSNPQDVKLPKNDITKAMNNQMHDLKNNYVWNRYSNRVFNKIKNASTSWHHADLQACISYALIESENTVEKIRIINSITRIVRDADDSLSAENAKIALNLIECIMSKTQIGTITRKTDNLNQTINRCVVTLHNRSEFKNVDEFVNKYPYISCKYMHVGTYVGMHNSNNNNDRILIPK